MYKESINLEELFDDLLDEIKDKLIENENNEDDLEDLMSNFSIINHMDDWRRDHNNYYKTGEIFWKEFFKELDSIL